MPPKKFTLYFKSTADALMNESVNDSNEFYQNLLETALPLKQMMAKFSNNLDDDTMKNIDQVNSIPFYLLTSVSMLIDGPSVSNRQFSQSALTKAQSIQTNFCENKNYDIQQSRNILEKREKKRLLWVYIWH